MDRTTHQIFAPIFGFGGAFLLNKYGLAEITGLPSAVNILLPTTLSMLTSMTPDNDLHALKPYFVIWDSRPHEKKDGCYIIRNKQGKVSKVRPPKRMSSRYWGHIFKMVGVKRHRDFISHSPFIWAPIFGIPLFAIFKLGNIVAKTTNTPAMSQLFGLLFLIIMGLGLGYFSHIVGDMCTGMGIPTFSNKTNFSPMGMTLGKIPLLKRLPRANNRVWTTTFLVVAVDILLCIIFPSVAIPLNQTVWQTLKELVSTIFTTIINAIYGLITNSLAR